MNRQVFRASTNSGCLTIVFGTTALVLFGVGLRSTLEGGAGPALLFSLPVAGVALYSYLRFRNCKLEIDDEGLRSYDFTGGLLHIKWADIESAGIDPGSGELMPSLVFQTKHGPKRIELNHQEEFAVKRALKLKLGDRFEYRPPTYPAP